MTDNTVNKPDAFPIIKLWLLRLLVKLECHREFMSQGKFNNYELARLLEIPGIDSVDPDEDDDDETIVPKSAGKKESKDGFNERKHYQYLVKTHADMEKSAHRISLPQPLLSNLELLAVQAGLNEVECAILGFTILLNMNRLLHEINRWLGRELNWLKVYRILSVVLGYPEGKIQAAMSLRSPLAKTGLVVLTRHRHHDLDDMLNLLSLDFAVRIMSETDSPLEWLRDMVVQSSSPSLALADYRHLMEPLDVLQPYLRLSLEGRKPGVNVLLYGPPGTGKTQLVKVLAQEQGVLLYEIASEDDDGDPIMGERRLRALRSAMAFFQKTQAFLLFDEVEDVFNDGDGLFGRKSTAQTRKAWMNRFLEDNTLPVFWLGNSIHSVDPAFIRRFDWVIEVPVPPKVSISFEKCPLTASKSMQFNIVLILCSMPFFAV